MTDEQNPKTRVVLLRDIDENIMTKQGEFTAQGKKGETIELPEDIARALRTQDKVEYPEDQEYKFICAHCEERYKEPTYECRCGRTNIIPIRQWRISRTPTGEKKHSNQILGIYSKTVSIRQVRQGQDATYIITLDNYGEPVEIKISNEAMLTPKEFRAQYLLQFKLLLPIKYEDWCKLVTMWMEHPDFKIVEDTASTTESILREEIMSEIEEAYPTTNPAEAMRNESRYMYDENGNLQYCSRHIIKRRNIHTTIERIRLALDDIIADKPRRITHGGRREYFWVFSANKLKLKHATEILDEGGKDD